MTEALLGFAAVLLLVLARMPIAFAMGLVGVVGVGLQRGFDPSLSLASRIVLDAARDYGLSVVPLFILMGLFVNQSGMARNLYAAAYAFLGHLRGGLAMATVVSCGLFAAICGSSLATAATMSKVAMPEMRRYGYADSLSSASIAAGGTLGILIPPSVILVIYGLLTETSIAALFLAGVVPGVLGILLYVVAVAATVARKPQAGPAGARTDIRGRLAALRGIIAVLLVFVFVIGGLYGLFDFEPLNLTFSPTEAAGVGAAGTFLIALLSGKMTWTSLLATLRETTTTTAGLFVVLIGAWIFSNFVNLAGLPEELLVMIEAANMSPMTVIILILLIYLLLGCVFESLSMLLLTVPVFFPVVVGLGFDPVWFGIVVVIAVEISLITPPVGLNVFVLKSVVGDISTRVIFRGVTPFWLVDVFRLLLVVAVPATALALPGAIR